MGLECTTMLQDRDGLRLTLLPLRYIWMVSPDATCH